MKKILALVSIMMVGANLNAQDQSSAFSDAVDLGNGVYENWIGTFATVPSGSPLSTETFIDHAEHGRLYLAANGQDVYLYDPNIAALGDPFHGWIYTNRFLHPFFYVYGANVWVKFLPGVIAEGTMPRVFVVWDDGSDLLLPKYDASGIVGVAVANSEFSTLVTALSAANLVDTLSGPGPFTVFAPTNDAFDMLPEGALTALVGDVDALTEVLTYHVVPGRYYASDLLGPMGNEVMDAYVSFELTTVQGCKIRVMPTPMGLMLNETTMVTAADIDTANGIIHVIDSVLMPPQTITDIVSTNEDFETLLAAVVAADLADTLDGDGPFTVFAPTDDAFAALPEGALDGLLADVDALTNVLLYHVVGAEVYAADLGADLANLLAGSMSSGFAPTASGIDLPISVTPNGVVVGDVALVVTADIMAKNGVIHVIDAVLLPPGTIVDVAVEAGFSTLAGALTTADLVDTLNGEGPFTVFAPTNEAFDALPEGFLAGLSVQELTDILTYHVVPAKVYSSEVAPGAVPTVNGATIDVTINEAGDIILNGSSQVIATDVVGSNGVIHIIDTVITPPAP